MGEVGVDVSSDIEEYERRLKNIRREIVDKATNIIPRFIEIAEVLRLSRDDILEFFVKLHLYIHIGSFTRSTTS